MFFAGKRQKKEIDMLNGPYFKKLLAFALPIALTGLIQFLYNAADTAIIGRFAGSKELAAMGTTPNIIVLANGLVGGIAVGVGILVANLIGAEDDEGVKNTIHTSMLFSLICGIVTGLSAIIAIGPILRIMNTPQEIIGLSAIYLRIYFLGTPIQMILNFGGEIIRAEGDSKTYMVALSLSGLLNVVLNVFLVVVIHLGIAGVAIATVISQLMAAVVILRKMIKNDGTCRLEIKRLKINRGSLTRIVKNGLPVGLQRTVSNLSATIIQAAINSFGAATLAALSAEGNVKSGIYFLTNAFSQAVMTFISQNLGAQKYVNIRRIFWQGLAIPCVLMLVCAVGSITFAMPLLSFFTKDIEVLEIAREILNFEMKTYIFAVIFDVIAMSLYGVGLSKKVMVITLVGICGFRVLWIYTILPLNPTIISVYLATAISYVCCSVIAYFILNKKFNELSGERLIRLGKKI